MSAASSDDDETSAGSTSLSEVESSAASSSSASASSSAASDASIKNDERRQSSASALRVLDREKLSRERRLQRLVSLRHFPVASRTPFTATTSPAVVTDIATGLAALPLTSSFRFASRETVGDDDALLLQFLHRHDVFHRVIAELEALEGTTRRLDTVHEMTLTDLARLVSPSFARAFPSSERSHDATGQATATSDAWRLLERPRLIANLAVEYLDKQDEVEVTARKRGREETEKEMSHDTDIPLADSAPMRTPQPTQSLDTSATGGLVPDSSALWQSHMAATAAAEGVSVRALRLAPAQASHQFVDRQSFIERVHMREHAELLRLEKIAEEQAQRRAERRHANR